MRPAVVAFVLLLCACPPGLGAKTVSCVPDGGLLGCFEWSGADLPALGAIELTCAQLGSMSRAESCPSELRVTGCRVERSAFVETRWYRAGGGGEVLADCADAGRLVVYAEDEVDAGAVEPLNDAGMRCSVTGGAMATITFINVSSSPVVPKWTTPGTCSEFAYAPIPAGGGVNQPTFVGHVWRFRRDTAGGPLMREYTVEAVSGSVAIR